MGACDFRTKASGANAHQAFAAAVRDAQWEHGHGGYTGTIAEVDGFVMVTVPAGVEPTTYAQWVLNGCAHVEVEVPGATYNDMRGATTMRGDKFYRTERRDVPDAYRAAVARDEQRVDDKWGPCGCIALGGEEFLFFGWASS